MTTLYFVILGAMLLAACVGYWTTHRRRKKSVPQPVTDWRRVRAGRWFVIKQVGDWAKLGAEVLYVDFTSGTEEWRRFGSMLNEFRPYELVVHRDSVPEYLSGKVKLPHIHLSN